MFGNSHIEYQLISVYTKWGLGFRLSGFCFSYFLTAVSETERRARGPEKKSLIVMVIVIVVLQ